MAQIVINLRLRMWCLGCKCQDNGASPMCGFLGLPSISWKTGQAAHRLCVLLRVAGFFDSATQSQRQCMTVELAVRNSQELASKP